MAIYLKDDGDLNFKTGSHQVKKIFLGDTLVWPCEYPASLLLKFNDSFEDSSYNVYLTNNYGGYSSSGIFGGSIAFDGSERLEINTNNEINFGLDDFTVELWYYPETGNNSEHTLFSQASPIDGVSIQLSLYQEDLYWLVGTSGSWSFSHVAANGDFTSGTVNIQQWNHVALTRKNGIFRLFSNGDLVDTYTNTLNLQDYNGLISIGGRSNYSQYFIGKIDEVRVVKGIALYQGDFIVPSQPLAICEVPSPCSYTKVLLNFNGNNNATSTTDSSVNNYTVVFQNNAKISTTQSKFGGSSLFCNGSVSNDGVTISDPTSTNTFAADISSYWTIEMWFYATALHNGNLVIIADNALTIPGFQINLMNDGSIICNNASASAIQTDPSTYSINTWHHIAAARCNGIIKLYLDGNLIGSTDQTPASAGNKIAIGASNTNFGNYFFQGYIDDFRYIMYKAYDGDTTITIPTQQLDSCVSQNFCESIGTPTPTPTLTATPTTTPTTTPTNTPSLSQSPTNTPSLSQTPTNTPSLSQTPTNTPSLSQSPTNTPSLSQSPTNTPSITPTNTPSITPTNTPESFTPQAVVLTSDTSYTVPAGATTMKVWAIGGGAGSTFNCDGGGLSAGANGAIAVQSFSVTGGSPVDYSIGSGGPQICDGGAGRNGGNTVVTYNAVSVTGGGGYDTSVGFTWSAANGVCSGEAVCGVAGNNVDGINAAVTLAGGSIAGKGAAGSNGAGGAGAVVLYFT